MTSGPREGLPTALRLASLAPPVLVTLLVARYAVDVPFWDTWDWLDRHYPAEPASSDATMRRYWALFNDHRVFIPLLVDRLCLWASGIDILPRIWLKLPLSIASFWLTLRLARQTAPGAALPWLGLALSCLAFPLTYWPLWVDPRQFSVHIVVLALMSALVAATSRRSPGTRAVLAAAACLVASLSYTPGLFTWPFVGLVLWGQPSRPSAPAMAVWAAGAMLLIGLHGVDLMNGATQAASAAPHPLAAANAALAIAGLPVAPALLPLAYLPTRLVGLCGVGALAWLALAAWKRDGTARLHALPWIALGGWGAAYALASGWARGGLPLGALHDPRFAYLAAQIWLAVAVLLAQYTALPPLGSGRPRRARLAVVASVVLAFSYGVASLRPFLAPGGIGRFTATLEAGRECLLRFRTADSDCLALLYPEPSRLREIAARLQARDAAFLPLPQPDEATGPTSEPREQQQPEQ